MTPNPTRTAALMLRGLAEKATPQPWVDARHTAGGRAITGPEKAEVIARTFAGRDHDAALIVAMRNNLPGILARLAALERVAEAARALSIVSRLTGYSPHKPLTDRLYDAIHALDQLDTP